MMKSIIIFSSLLLSANAMRFEIDKVIHNDADTNTPILTFGMLDSGCIKHVHLTDSYMYKLSETDSQTLQRKTIDVNTTNSDANTANNCSLYMTNTKGFYQLYIASNAPSKSADTKITGSIHVTHNYGELSPDEYRSYQYYSCALYAVLLLAVTWSVLMQRYRASLVKHHYAIGIMIWILAIETVLNYFKLMCVNYTGQQSVVLDFVHIQSEVIRQTYSRLVLILISLGWGIILPSSQITPPMKHALITLGLLYYFGQSLLSHLLNAVVRTGNFTHFWLIVPLIVAQCVLESWLFWTVLTNLADIFGQLRKHGQFAKYEHYKQFVQAMAVLMVLAALNVLLEFYVRHHVESYFDLVVLCRTCFWHLLCVLMTAIVMVLWRPTKSSQLYAFVEQVPNDEFDFFDQDEHAAVVVREIDIDTQIMHISDLDDDEEGEEKGNALDTRYQVYDDMDAEDLDLALDSELDLSSGHDDCL